MPDLNHPELDAIAEKAREWRHAIHRQPELLFDLPQTASFVADKLDEFGCDEVHRGIAGSGVVAIINGTGNTGCSIALRADMDALPIHERTNLPYASAVEGRMHACGHDGHTAMLLAAACHLSRHRDFPGRVVLIFQPAEEGGGGARVMIDEGLLDRFAIDEVYALHNRPGLPVGDFASRPGPILAAGDRFMIRLQGRGGHAASPHLARDAILAQAHLVSALQMIASRHTDPLDSVVLSVTYLEAGNPDALNVIPGEISIGGTLRSLRPETRRQAEARLREILSGTAAAFGVDAELDWRPGYPVTINDPDIAHAALDAARAIAPDERVDDSCPPEMGSEDFSYMLERRPGAFVWIGNGDSADLHNAAYDFNDEAIIHGLRFWLGIVQARAALR
ncbi:amidohydrolase [Paracoccus onubensis]|uniref:Amidohydrolase n=2 Tax=Paracoccus onubensis TaxID=1675788 RepID=A0A418SMC8_9RHOB|nr:amidohydrolase [Paracoccus onubensis]